MSELFWQVVGDDLGTLLALTLAGAAIAYCQNLQARSDQDYVPLAPRALPRRARNRVGVTYRATRHVDPFYQAHLGATLPVGLSGDELSGDEEAEVAIWHRETQAKKRRGGPNYRGALRIFGGYDEEKNKEPKKRGKKEKNGLTLTEESKPACDGDTDAANNSTAASMISEQKTIPININC